MANNDYPESMKSDLTAPKLPVDPETPLDHVNDPFPTDPEPSNADNTAVDSFLNIHSGSAIPDPIGRTLEDARVENTIDYYPPEIIDEDPVLGGPEGIANQINEPDPIDNIADIDVPPEDPEA